MVPVTKSYSLAHRSCVPGRGQATPILEEAQRQAVAAPHAYLTVCPELDTTV